ncbi:hypothetical protein B0H17DRAFT_1142262 [Mycena rosella]|uniref:BHLH domain-containing protein n=1 Tax=Mycena rosella TaxID=1033263 RepID=A0AAD7CY46_MYCRO|nr:hypothetical protein B0H17DRAFT_1142262 [Mycena rosella]
MSSDLGLDPSDPLNLLLHNHSQHDGADTDTDEAATPPDWNTLSSMWPPVDDSKMDFNMDFGLMDMSFDPAVGIEPNALAYPYSTPDPFQFTFESSHMSSSSSSESGSTSGSFSPLVAYSPPSSSEFDEDPATELASRVRKSAGMVLAVPINQNQQQQQQQQQVQQQQRQHQHQHPSSQGPAYTPPPSAFTTTPVPAPILLNTPASTAPQPRPKTSHTTIERRYRTNLNARIQSLRQAVPALRVVDRAAAAKAGEPVEDDGPEDFVDARGFVDGVKVARKCSKANVLGKAVEYIRVLKNREARLARELGGLKTLLGGLVGGRELLHEWEREWFARFGGPETDEVGDGGGTVEEDADEDEEESDEDGAGRKRKKPKVDPKPKPERKPAAAPAADGEKKKRGRPRKVVPLPAAALTPALSTSVPMQEPPQRQYLLGAFALFSFFANANVSGPPPAAHHAHEGHVLTRVPVRAEGMGLLQAFHLLASIAVLASVLLPLGKSVYARLRAPPAVVVAPVVPEKAAAPPPTPISDDDDTDGDMDLSLSSTSSDDEPAAPAPHLAAAEACILNDSTPLATRLRTAAHLYTTSASPDDRRLLALLVRPVPLLGARLARGLWGAGMGLPLDEAARRVAGALRTDKGVLRTLQEGVAVERLRAVSSRAFVRDVLGGEEDPDAADTATEERERALSLAHSLGGRVGALGGRVGRVLGGGAFDLASDSETEDDVEGASDDVEKLLRAIVLYRRVFGATADTLHPEDGPALRRTLGSSEVFEDALVEEARDRVVDLLTGEQ